jgi:class 3 adenylate cyclase
MSLPSINSRNTSARESVSAGGRFGPRPSPVTDAEPYYLPSVIDDTGLGPGAAAATYRGFLFSDVRGFTAFAERHGNAAAAAMVGRFLEIARAAIARHEGAELKTEGDNIHAVFPSASGAVLCGLEIVEGAAELNAREPDRPLGLGVGIHAGEAVETAGGYIGRAVNIAARLCAVARPGEVLVSSTVKGITQASIPVGFIPRGRRRLKGISDPILVYAVSRDPNAKAPFRLPDGLVAAGAAAGAVLALAAIVAVGGPLLFGKAGAQPPPSVVPAAPTAQPVSMGPLTIGTYVPRSFQPRLRFDIADLGWTASRDDPASLALVREDPPRGSVYFARVQRVLTDPCGGDAGGTTGPAAGDVIGQLRALPGHIQLSDEMTIELGGAAARQVDVTIADGAQAACGGLVGADIPVFALGDEAWSASPGERFRLISVDVAGQELTVIVSIDWTKTHSVQELEDMFKIGGKLLQTVEF